MKQKSNTVIKRIICLVCSVCVILSVCAMPVNAADSGVPFYDGVWPETLIDPDREFQLGIVVHYPGHANYREDRVEQYMKLTAESGASLVRFGASGTDTESLLILDKWVETAEAYGLDIMMILQFSDEDYTYDAVYQNASVYVKRYKGRIKYYQLSNETSGYLHPDGGLPGYGREISNYHPLKMKVVTEYMRALSNAVADFDSQAKRVINTTWLHTGMIKYYQQSGVNFEVVGLDWYENGDINVSTGNIWLDRPTFDYSYGNNASLCEDLLTHFPDKEYMICESNYWPQTEVDYDKQTEYYMTLINRAYNSPLGDKMLGIIVYELLDQPNHSNTKGGTVYNGEANLGLFTTSFGDKNTTEILEAKPLYYELQKLFGGKSVEADWSLAGKPIIETPPSLGEDPDITEDTVSSSPSVNISDNDFFSESLEFVETEIPEELEEEKAGEKTATSIKTYTTTVVAFPPWAIAAISVLGILLAGGIIFLLQLRFNIFKTKKKGSSV